MDMQNKVTSIINCKFKKAVLPYCLVVLFTFLMITPLSVNAESLFTLGATQHYQGTPRSLFGGVQAHQIGDLISIRMTENISVSDNLTYSSAKSSETTDSFTSFLRQNLQDIG